MVEILILIYTVGHQAEILHLRILWLKLKVAASTMEFSQEPPFGLLTVESLLLGTVHSIPW